MLTIKNLKKSFSSQSAPVLKEINFSVEKGAFCIIIGSNGSGKSTLLKSLSGELTIDSGEITMNNQPIRREHIASVVQDPNLGTVPALTLLENMVLGAGRGKTPTFELYTKQREKIRALLESFDRGLIPYIDTPLQRLSGGQRQIIAVLIATFTPPSLLLLDEHTSALDPATQKKLMEYTAHYTETHKITTMMITHKLDDALTYGDRLIMLHKGRVVIDLTANEKAALTREKLLALFHRYEDDNYV